MGFNSDTGEFTGLPKEWQQLLQESGISRQDQEANPQAVMDIVAFYQDATQHATDQDAVWKKFEDAKGSKVNPNTVESGPGIAGTMPVKGVYEKPRAAPPPPGGPSRQPSQSQQGGGMYSPRPAPSPPMVNSGAAVPVKPSATDKLVRRMSSQKSAGPSAPSSSRPAPPPPSGASTSTSPSGTVAKGKAPVGPGATPRRRETKKNTMKDSEVIARLQAICTDADPTKLYRSLVKIGQGASGGVYTAYQVGTNVSVAIKQMNLEQQPKKDLIINEILVMKESRHRNIVNFIDSFLFKGDLWVVMEYMEGGSLTDVVTCNIMTEGQIAAVSREVLEGLKHLHEHAVIHRDIKSDNILLSMEGEIKLSEYELSGNQDLEGVAY